MNQHQYSHAAPQQLRALLRRAALGIIAAGALLAIGYALVPASADAAPRRQATWAPHLDRQIVARRTTSHGKQLATWYGPGLFGNRTACGQTLTPKTWGIAHRTLPCGTLVTLRHGNRKVTVRVIDRGPFSGATVDLTSRTKSYLRFVSGTVRMQQVRRFRVLPKPKPRVTSRFAATTASVRVQ